MLASPLSRRRLLAIGATTGIATLAGCLDGCFDDVPFLGTGMEHDGEIATERTEAVPDHATIVEFSDLPEVEQSLLRTAVEEGVVRACMSERGDQADAISSFANRFEGESSYLAYESDYYALWVRIEDVVVAHSASPPGSDENPCC